MLFFTSAAFIIYLLLRALTMMATEYTFTGRDGEAIPRHITHVLIDKALKFVPARAFQRHPNIVEVICHDGVEKIEEWAFHFCPSLRRVIIPGVKVIKNDAFYGCSVLTSIECGKLEKIGQDAFGVCKSLSGIDLLSTKIVKMEAFDGCTNLTYAKFGKNLESIGKETFLFCRSLEHITIPLKDGMITNDSVFAGCKNLERVDLVGGVHETVAALLLEEWRNDMNEEIDAINQILPNTPAGGWDWVNNEIDPGEKAQAIRTWIRKVLRKYIYYKAEHRRYVNEAAATLELALPHDIVFKNILPFVELPSDTSEGEDLER